MASLSGGCSLQITGEVAIDRHPPASNVPGLVLGPTRKKKREGGDLASKAVLTDILQDVGKY